MTYVGLFVWPMPKRNVAKYRKESKRVAKVYRELGALEYREYVQAPGKIPGTKTVPALAAPKRGEAVVVLLVTFRSKAHMERVRRKIDAYPWPPDGPELFDAGRMAYGEFETIVDA